MSTFWLSFADGRLPAGQQFLGACIVRSGSFMEAVMQAHASGINPGGEVQAMELPSDAVIHETWFDVLLDEATIEQHDTLEGWAASRPAHD